MRISPLLYPTAQLCFFLITVFVMLVRPLSTFFIANQYFFQLIAFLCMIVIIRRDAAYKLSSLQSIATLCMIVPIAHRFFTYQRTMFLHAGVIMHMTWIIFQFTT